MVHFLYKTTLLSAVAAAALSQVPAQAEPMPFASGFAIAGGIGLVTTSDETPVAFAEQDISSGGFFSIAAGRATTTYETRASANNEGNGRASGTAQLNETITNDTSDRREYFFNFEIGRGSMTIRPATPELMTSTDTATAQLLSQVSVDGNDIWSIGLELALADFDFSIPDGNDNDSGMLAGFDTSSFNPFAGGEINWSATQFSVALGQLDPGESFDFEYLLNASTAASYETGCFEVIPDGYGEGDERTICSFTDAFVIDPAGINSFGISSQLAAPAPPPSVAEPASMALLGIGLAGMGLGRRRFAKR